MDDFLPAIFCVAELVFASPCLIAAFGCGMLLVAKSDQLGAAAIPALGAMGLFCLAEGSEAIYQLLPDFGPLPIGALDLYSWDYVITEVAAAIFRGGACVLSVAALFTLTPRDVLPRDEGRAQLESPGQTVSDDFFEVDLP
ncbi:hypothetical protein [Stratiformator vulcanicus]|uniref:Uncharacterized protein n=1 Tax=Stratiformator vulcanicus TaxID=2527980 RepID=A0A517QZD4_9PLAN|nr:hypothetical protein [Stratiformator vulcanicus]QDT37005.1 hypothetical protein Pan189_13700 [Stratiformator vulcanicus]